MDLNVYFHCPYHNLTYIFLISIRMDTFTCISQEQCFSGR